MPEAEALGPEMERDLEEAAASGDTAALSQLLRRHREPLTRQLARKLPQDLRGVIGAEDVVQEACVEALCAVRQRAFRRAGPSSFQRWLWKIAIHRLYDLVKSHRRHKRAASAACGDGTQRAGPADGADAPAPEHEQPGGPALRHEAAAALRRALTLLSPDSGLAIEMHYLQELSIAEVACRLGRSEGAVLMLCNRAIKRLRGLLAGFVSACMTPVLYCWLDGMV